MQKTLLSIFVFFIAFSAKAQDFTVHSDTAYGTLHDIALYDRITNLESDSIAITWRVIACDFPSSWYGAGGQLNLCDNHGCYSDTWNASTETGPTYTSNKYGPESPGIFDYAAPVVFADTPETGLHYITVRLKTFSGTYSRNVTFAISNWPTSVPAIKKAEDIALYPVPAHNNLNVTYRPEDGIKTISLYNIIGKLLAVYKTTSGTGASINLENVPAGMYFMRLSDVQGNTLSTQKFIKQ